MKIDVIAEIMSIPYQVNNSWVVDIKVLTARGIESTHIFCKSFIDAGNVKIDDPIYFDVQ